MDEQDKEAQEHGFGSAEDLRKAKEGEPLFLVIGGAVLVFLVLLILVKLFG